VNQAIPAAIATTKMGANSMLGTFGIWVITVIQDHELNITEDRFHRIVIRATFGQADPVKVKITHHLTSKP
jgi:hypothetical protein